MTPRRLIRFQQLLSAHHFSAAVISKRENIQYLTSLHQLHPTNREAVLFVTPQKVLLYHSLFLKPPTINGLESQIMDKRHSIDIILNYMVPKSAKADQIAIEAHDLKVAELEKFKTILPKAQFIPLNSTLQLETARQIKSASEIDSILQACQITNVTMTWIIKKLRQSTKPLTEIQVARSIENHMYDLGAHGLAFPTVVAFNAHSASPHHQVGHSKLTKNSVVLLDFGCQVNGYASDMTRTFCLGTPPPRFKHVETTVLAAYSAAINTISKHFRCKELTQTPIVPKRLHQPANVKPDVTSTQSSKYHMNNTTLTAASVDQAARSVIEEAGFGDQFIHTTGHSLGLEIHEQPSISSINQQELKPGMVLTIEPGIYFQGKFGYRHENTILLV